MRVFQTVPRSLLALTACAALVAVTTDCAANRTTTRATTRDKTAKGAGIGAAAGAAVAVATGKRQADEILTRAAIGAAIGAGVGAYMDAQEEKLARIPGTSVERVDEETLLVHFDSDILFAVDQATLSSQALTTLTEVSGVLTEYPKTAVVIHGHTDSTGTDAHNQQLSERRAESVRGDLVGRGVTAERMATSGYGESQPIASNDTEDGRSRNRRVDILLKAKAR